MFIVFNQLKLTIINFLHVANPFFTPLTAFLNSSLLLYCFTHNIYLLISFTIPPLLSFAPVKHSPMLLWAALPMYLLRWGTGNRLHLQLISSPQLSACPRYLWTALPPKLLRRRIRNRPLHLISPTCFHHRSPSVTVFTPYNSNFYNHTTRPARPPLPLPLAHTQQPFSRHSFDIIYHAFLLLHLLHTLPTFASLSTTKLFPTSYNLYSHFNTHFLKSLQSLPLSYYLVTYT